MTKIIGLIGLAVVLASLVVCRPDWLTENTFLESLISSEILSLLSVMLTVTLASVANIHLAINRIVANHLSDNQQQKKIAQEIKSEIQSNAWFIFYAFIAAILVLFVKGLNDSDVLVTSICNAIMLWLLFFNLLCVFDIYKVIYGIVDLESTLQDKQNVGAGNKKI